MRKYADDMTIGAQEKPWPKHYIVVGTNGGGDYWFIDITHQKKGLWFWNHETQRVKKYDANFEAYLMRLKKALAKPEDWQ